MRQVHLKEIKEIRDYLLRSEFNFRPAVIKFVIEAAFKKYHENNNRNSSHSDISDRLVA